MLALLFAAIMSPLVSSIGFENNANADLAKKNSEIIDSFRHNVMDKNVTVNDTAPILPLLNACYGLGNTVFAEDIWNYITIHCMMKPTQLIYSKLLNIYQKVEPVDVFKCIQLVQTYMDQYEEDRASLYANEQPKTPLHSPIILNQMIKIILFKSDWSNATMREHITRYQHDMIRLKMNPDAVTIRLFGIASVQPIHEYKFTNGRHDSADGSKTFDTYTESMHYRHYQQWLRVTPQFVIDSFQKNVMDEQVTLQTTLLIVPVFGACYYLKDATFASKVWDYIAHYCQMKPNQKLYSKLLGIYQSVRPVDVKKCKQLVMQWIDVYEHDPESLRHGISTHYRGVLRRDFVLESPIILNQIMKIMLFKSRGNWLDRQASAYDFYREMIRLKIKPDSETIRLLHVLRDEISRAGNGSLQSTNERREVDDIFENLQNLESYLVTEFTALNQSHDAQSWNDIQRLFHTYVIEDRMVVTSHLLVELVFDACIKLKDIVFIEEVWQYIT
eukprot:9355_1